MDPLALAAALSVMGAIIAFMVALNQAAASPRSQMTRRLGTLLGEAQGGDVRAGDYEALRPKKAGQTPIISAILEGRLWTSMMAERLERADLKLTVSEFVSLRLLLALTAAAVIALTLGPKAIGLVVAAGAAAVGWSIPGFFVSYSIKQRVKKLDHQLLEALGMMSNSLKSGFGLMQTFELVSRQLDHPIATEFRRMLYDVNVGSSTEAALQALAQRSGSNDCDIVVTAMLIQQTTGGNLGEILDNVAHTMRERVRIRGEIATLTSQQMLTGFIIGGLPFAMAGGFMAVSPDYMKPLLETTLGHLMLLGSVMLELFGIALIKKILSIEV